MSSGVFVRPVFSQDPLEEEHCKVVRVCNGGCIEKDSWINIVQFIISHDYQRWSEIGFFRIRANYILSFI